MSVSFASNSTSVCTVSGTTATILSAGSCSITASQAGNANYFPASSTKSFTVNKANQTASITSTAPTNATVGGSSYTVAATATSGLTPALTISASSSAVCGIAGSTVSFNGAGTCTVNANQSGNANYNAAPQAQQSFTVSKTAQTISFSSIAPTNAVVAGASYNIGATASSGLTVSFSAAAASAGICSVSGSTVSFLGAGTCRIDANQAGNATYDPAPQVFQSFAVSKQSQTVSFSSTAPTNAEVGGATYAVSATATSGLTPALTVDAGSAAICSIAGSTVSFSSAGTCRINANQAGNATYDPAPQVFQSFAVSKQSQTVSFSSTAPTNAEVGGATYAVSATATSGLTPALTVDAGSAAICSIAGSTVSFSSAGTCRINANQAGNATYDPAPQVFQSFAVSKQSQTVSFSSTAPTNAEVGGATYAVSATATSGLTPALTVDAGSAAICSIAGSTVSFSSAGTCRINANQAGNATYDPAPQAFQSFAVSKQSQTVSFSSTAPTNAAPSGTYVASASATSGLTVALSIDASSSGICSMAGSTVTFSNLGNCRINADQAGDATYDPASTFQDVTVGNSAPTASAGPDQASIASGANVTLDGSASNDTDPGQVLSYKWRQLSGSNVTLSSTTVGNPSFDAPTLAVGVPSEVLVFELVVNDGHTASSPDTVTITVRDQTAPSVTITGLPGKLEANTSAQVAVTFTEPVTGFVETDLTVVNASVSNFAGSGAVYTASITALSSGDISLSVAKNVAQDSAGNKNAASAIVTAKLTATKVTYKLLANSAKKRGQSLLSSQPNLGSFFRSQRGSFVGRLSSRGGDFKLSTKPENPVWLFAQGRWSSNGGVQDSYIHAAVGAHLLQRENFILGAMLQGDHGSSRDGVAALDANGWLIGPYFVARSPDGKQVFSGSWLVGRTDIALSPLGTYQDEVTADRNVFTLSMSHEISISKLTLYPTLDLANITEKRPSYVDGLGQTIAAGNLNLFEASAGLDFSIPTAVSSGTGEVTGGLSAIYAHYDVDGAIEEDLRGRVDFGLNRQFDNGVIFNVNISYDGIGAPERGSVGADLLISKNF
ncbi:hypothetical protein KKW20_12260 [Planktotalea lamellibrachiae]|nr:hypothetical protein [Aliiroseovarius lamellibrachiae]